MKKLLLAIVAVCLFPAICFAGPFGTNMGDTIDKYPDASKPVDGGYITTQMPNSNSAFEFYVLYFASSGLHQVTAHSKIEHNDAFGIGTRMLFDKIKNQLTNKYGQPKCAEGLRSGAILVEDRDFIMSILKNERLHACFWSGRELADDLSQIAMIISANGPDSSSVLLDYKYKNTINAEKQKQSLEKDSL